MKMTRQDFLASKPKAISVLGMSGSGKSYISGILSKCGWHSYSCDYEIGTKYLKDRLSTVVKTDDISALSVYLGKVGAAEKGGFSLDLFLKRQKDYYDAEHAAISHMLYDIEQTDRNFIHDTTGSFCEINDPDLIDKIGQKTLFIYLKADPEDEADILQRAQDYPKPLFFPSDKFLVWLNDYVTLHQLSGVDAVDPDDFSRWVFPRLFESRKPKYQALADQYGVTIRSREFLGFKTSDDFISVVAEHLDQS